MTKKRNKIVKVELTPSQAKIFDAVFKEFSSDGNAFNFHWKTESRALFGGFIVMMAWVLQSRISPDQWAAYEDASDEALLNLCLAYSLAVRGRRGYSIDKDKIVHGANLKQEIIKG